MYPSHTIIQNSKSKKPLYSAFYYIKLYPDYIKTRATAARAEEQVGHSGPDPLSTF